MPEHDELIDELRSLGRALAVPEAVDQRSAVRARLAQPARRPRLRLFLAAAAAALIATVTLVAPARAAVVEVVSDLLRVAGIEVRRELPAGALPATPSPLPSTRTADLVEAERAAGFPVLAPELLGPPEEVLLADPDAQGRPRVVTLIYRGGTVRFDQFSGGLDPIFIKMTPNTEWVPELAGTSHAALWLPEPHPLTYIGTDGVKRDETARLAGPTLIWETPQPVTYRLEGFATREEAVRVALSVR
ncbi:hypothetical protein OHA21_25165 [Actinoplanes sp. NBC_00393]|uniref:hypothetical protein n=1 Tax=Actinoplanes sp. NBC_00393 TaxID=2975953 RepID=UPI002E24486D